jgi:hypothetical protein
LFVANPGDGTVSVFRAPTPAEGRRAGSLARIPTIVKGRLLLPRPHTGVLLDISGGVVCKLKSGYNEVGHCPAGIYFVREARSQSIRKVVVVK